MKAKEMMIGDWVAQKHSGLLLKVSEVRPPYIIADGEDGQFHEDTLEPIPLTDAILKRIGFEYYHKNFAALDRESPFQLEMIEWPNESGIGLWMVGGLIKIRFVHELQNAMRMAGIHKYIDIDDIRKDEP